MDKPDPDLLARLAALDEAERRAVMSFLAQPAHNSSSADGAETGRANDSAL